MNQCQATLLTVCDMWPIMTCTHVHVSVSVTAQQGVLQGSGHAGPGWALGSAATADVGND